MNTFFLLLEYLLQLLHHRRCDNLAIDVYSHLWNIFDMCVHIVPLTCLLFVCTQVGYINETISPRYRSPKPLLISYWQVIPILIPIPMSLVKWPSGIKLSALNYLDLINILWYLLLLSLDSPLIHIVTWILHNTCICEHSRRMTKVSSTKRSKRTFHTKSFNIIRMIEMSNTRIWKVIVDVT